MGKLALKQQIGIKTETVQNTAATLAAADFILVEDVTPPRPVPEMIERPLRQQTLDQMPHMIGQIFQEISFTVEIKGSGTAGTAYAPLGAIFKAMSFTETVDAGPPATVTYAPTSVTPADFISSARSATVEAYVDGIFHRLVGALVTSATLTMEAGRRPLLQITMQGLYADPTDTAFPNATFNNLLPPRVENADFVLNAGEVDEWEGIIQALSIDFGLQVAMVEDVNSPYGIFGFQHVGRQPTGSINPLAVALSEHNPFTKLKNGTAQTLAIKAGATAGNIVSFSMPSIQYNEANYGERNESLIWELPIRITRDQGDDYMTIVMT